MTKRFVARYVAVLMVGMLALYNVLDLLTGRWSSHDWLSMVSIAFGTGFWFGARPGNERSCDEK